MSPEQLQAQADARHEAIAQEALRTARDLYSGEADNLPVAVNYLVETGHWPDAAAAQAAILGETAPQDDPPIGDQPI